MTDNELEEKLAKIMDEIPEIEGLIAFNKEGEILSGQTITEMDNQKIVTRANELFKLALELGEATEKEGIAEINLNSKDGNIIIEGSKKLGVIALVGKEAAHSLALIMRTLRALLSNS